MADHPDDPTRPMTRTELAMLWDLCNRWAASHPNYQTYATVVASLADAELAERFGA